jgi:hypothetical protein
MTKSKTNSFETRSIDSGGSQTLPSVPPAVDIQGIMTNVSVLGNALSSPSVRTFIHRIGKSFIASAVQVKVKSGVPILDTLSHAGGIVGWTLKSPMVQKPFALLDEALDKGVLTPEMTMELINKPELIQDLAKQFATPPV